MNDPQTQLQANRQNEEVQTQWQGAAPQPLQDNGSTIPTGYLNMDLRGKVPQNPYQPPSTGEIHKQMWIGSMMLALMAGLASGNASAAIVGGMWGAIGIHDYGNTLRQRAQWTDKLQKEGYSGPAILKWYEDGDTSGLDKERDDMLNRDRLKQQEANHKEDIHQRELDRKQRAGESAERMGLEHQRLANMERHEHVMEGIAQQRLAATMGASSKQELAEQRQLFQTVRKGLEPEQTKLYYMGMANKSLKNLEDAVKSGDKAKAAGAYSQYRDNYARALLGGGATLNEHDMEGATGLPDWKGQLEQNASLFASGLPSDDWMKAQREAVNNETINAHQNLLHQGHQIYESQIQEGKTPEQAMKYTASAMQGTAIGNNDWSKDAEDQEPQAPTESQVDSVMAKYGHAKK